MIDWYTSGTHGVNKFFGKVIRFGTVPQTHSNLIGRQESEVLVIVEAGSCSPHIIVRRPSDPKLRKIAELRPCLRKAEQLDPSIEYHSIPGPEVRLQEPKASTEIINSGHYSTPDRSYSRPRQ